MEKPVKENLRRKIGQIEESLRNEVIQTLGNDKELLPRHLVDACIGKMQQEIKEDPTKDDGRFNRIEGIIIHFSLRQIQDTITARSLWNNFEGKFRNKQKLNERFSQLVNLRNCIDHSRPYDTDIEKDGEASIYWFEKVLRS